MRRLTGRRDKLNSSNRGDRRAVLMGPVDAVGEG